ncbi:acyl-CoA carboxylase epsilon subunit [Streptomyces sp. NPDC056883]|uniref:acyl-CoA carboxylase epsilon subunit n=1 Tax=Streptomyces sp. NPDC056883 TaxID=3345959 RepID=UPI00369F9F29
MSGSVEPTAAGGGPASEELYAVLSGNPTPEELCAVLVALRLASAPAAAPAHPKSVRRTDPWPVPRSAPPVPPVSWAR